MTIEKDAGLAGLYICNPDCKTASEGLTDCYC